MEFFIIFVSQDLEHSVFEKFLIEQVKVIQAVSDFINGILTHRIMSDSWFIWII